MYMHQAYAYMQLCSESSNLVLIFISVIPDNAEDNILGDEWRGATIQ